MSAQQGHERGGAGDDGAPDAKRQRLDDQGDTPDPEKIVIKLQGHAETFVVDRETAMDNCLYFRAAMGGNFLPSVTGTIELEESDFAKPATLKLLKDYFEYLEDVAINADTDEDILPDPMEDLDTFDELADFWLLGDYLQSQTITDKIMEEFEARQDDMEPMTEGLFKSWWEKLEGQPLFHELRGAMLALFVASDEFKEANSRHAIMPRLPAAAQQAVVDELLRQHKIVEEELRAGLRELEQYVDRDGLQKINMTTAKVSKKFAARDFIKPYINYRDRD